MNQLLFCQGGVYDAGAGAYVPVGGCQTLDKTTLAIGASDPLVNVLVEGWEVAESPSTVLFGSAYATPLSYRWAAGKFTPTASVPSRSRDRAKGARFGASLDRIIVATGGDDATTDIWTIASESWSVGPPMSSVRDRAGMVGLLDGSVLVVGGFDKSSVPVPTSERLDAAGSKWTPHTFIPLISMSLVRLSDGRVLSLGGYDENGLPSSAVRRFDPATDAWAPAKPLPMARADIAAILLPDGRVFAAGGQSYDGEFHSQPETWFYDPLGDAWSPGPSLPKPRDSVSLAVVGKRVVVVGGQTVSGATIGYDTSILTLDLP